MAGGEQSTSPCATKLSVNSEIIDDAAADARSTDALNSESTLRKELRFFFMNPIQKWQVRGQFPFKFLILALKVFLVTAQLCIFAGNRNEHFNYGWGSKMAFSHLFLYNWESTREIKSYPPSEGPLALYERNQFQEALEYAVTGYRNLSNAIGPYSYLYDKQTGKVLPIVFCVENYSNVVEQDEELFENLQVKKNCCNIEVTPGVNDSSFFDNPACPSPEVSVNFKTLIKATLNFTLKAIRYRRNEVYCTAFEIIVQFDNNECDGRLQLSLETKTYIANCRNKYKQSDLTWRDTVLENWLNYSVIAVCLVSLILCSRAIYRAQLLKQRTMKYFKAVRNENLSMECRMQFWNFWYITIIVNDVLIIAGTYMQEEISRNRFASNEWNACSLLLGTGNLLVWFGILRYLGFFKTYNVVMITVKSAFPAVMRFMSCAMLIYCGFVFCGWLVFGPFHMKFRSLSTTSECLFSLINGDDMFATFNILEAKSTVLFFYMRAYIYCFTSLFIYVILSLLLSIIIDAYETIKEYYERGFPKTDVEKFIDEADPNGEYLIPNGCGDMNTRRGYTFKRFLSSLVACRRIG